MSGFNSTPDSHWSWDDAYTTPSPASRKQLEPELGYNPRSLDDVLPYTPPQFRRAAAGSGLLGFTSQTVKSGSYRAGDVKGHAEQDQAHGELLQQTGPLNYQQEKDHVQAGKWSWSFSAQLPQSQSPVKTATKQQHWQQQQHSLQLQQKPPPQPPAARPAPIPALKPTPAAAAGVPSTHAITALSAAAAQLALTGAQEASRGLAGLAPHAISAGKHVSTGISSLLDHWMGVDPSLQGAAATTAGMTTPGGAATDREAAAAGGGARATAAAGAGAVGGAGGRDHVGLGRNGMQQQVAGGVADGGRAGRYQGVSAHQYQKQQQQQEEPHQQQQPTQEQHGWWSQRQQQPKLQLQQQKQQQQGQPPAQDQEQRSQEQHGWWGQRQQLHPQQQPQPQQEQPPSPQQQQQQRQGGSTQLPAGLLLASAAAAGGGFLGEVFGALQLVVEDTLLPGGSLLWQGVRLVGYVCQQLLLPLLLLLLAALVKLLRMGWRWAAREWKHRQEQRQQQQQQEGQQQSQQQQEQQQASWSSRTSCDRSSFSDAKPSIAEGVAGPSGSGGAPFGGVSAARQGRSCQQQGSLRGMGGDVLGNQGAGWQPPGLGRQIAGWMPQIGMRGRGAIALGAGEGAAGTGTAGTAAAGTGAAAGAGASAAGGTGAGSAMGRTTADGPGVLSQPPLAATAAAPSVRHASQQLLEQRQMPLLKGRAATAGAAQAAPGVSAAPVVAVRAAMPAQPSAAATAAVMGLATQPASQGSPAAIAGTPVLGGFRTSLARLGLGQYGKAQVRTPHIVGAATPNPSAASSKPPPALTTHGCADAEDIAANAAITDVLGPDAAASSSAPPAAKATVATAAATAAQAAAVLSEKAGAAAAARSAPTAATATSATVATAAAATQEASIQSLIALGTSLLTSSSHLPLLPFSDLLAATNSFNQVQLLGLGRGYGPWAYQGKLQGNGVAVLARGLRSEEDVGVFCQRVRQLAALRHPHVLLLLGVSVGAVASAGESGLGSRGSSSSIGDDAFGTSSGCCLPGDMGMRRQWDFDKQRQQQGRKTSQGSSVREQSFAQQSKVIQEEVQQAAVLGCVVFELIPQPQPLLAVLLGEGTWGQWREARGCSREGLGTSAAVAPLYQQQQRQGQSMGRASFRAPCDNDCEDEALGRHVLLSSRLEAAIHFVAAVQYLLSRGEQMPLDAAALAGVVIVSCPTAASFSAQGPASAAGGAAGWRGAHYRGGVATSGSAATGVQGIAAPAAAARETGAAATGGAQKHSVLQASSLRVRPLLLEGEVAGFTSDSSSRSNGLGCHGVGSGMGGGVNSSLGGNSGGNTGARAEAGAGAMGGVLNGEGHYPVGFVERATQKAVLQVLLMAVTGKAVGEEFSLELLEKVVNEGLNGTSLEGTSAGGRMKRALLDMFARVLGMGSAGQEGEVEGGGFLLQLQQQLQELLDEAQQLEQEAAAAAQGEAAVASAAAARTPPSLFVCPLTYEVMTDPVVAADGFTYERAAISRWLLVAQRSPMTNKPMQRVLVPNHALRSSIQEWMTAL